MQKTKTLLSQHKRGGKPGKMGKLMKINSKLAALDRHSKENE